MANINRKTESSENQTVEVLYQKMGNRWFAFSLVDEEVFVGSITQDELDAAAPKNEASSAQAPIHRRLHVGNA